MWESGGRTACLCCQTFIVPVSTKESSAQLQLPALTVWMVQSCCSHLINTHFLFAFLLVLSGLGSRFLTCLITLMSSTCVSIAHLCPVAYAPQVWIFGPSLAALL